MPVGNVLSLKKNDLLDAMNAPQFWKREVVISISAHGEVYSIQHYVIKIVSDMRQVGGFLRVLRWPAPIKLYRHDIS